MWIHVIPHFQTFLANLELKPDERADAETKADGVARCLWKKFWLGPFNSRCYVKVGSYGKQTAVRPPSDLDMLFILPVSEYTRIEALQGNKQSQLLRQVKETLQDSYPNTDLSADGQIVLAPFQTYSVEVVPAFNWDGTSYVTANTANNGSWRHTNPAAEFAAIQLADSLSVGKATHLIRMLKAWKRECSVELKSISMEVLACEFVKQWTYRHQTIYYYDWMIRDFFEYMHPYENGGWTRVPGTAEVIHLGDEWITKRQSAYQRAIKACVYERADMEQEAAAEWRKVFGWQFSYRSALAMALASV